MREGASHGPSLKPWASFPLNGDAFLRAVGSVLQAEDRAYPGRWEEKKDESYYTARQKQASRDAEWFNFLECTETSVSTTELSFPYPTKFLSNQQCMVSSVVVFVHLQESKTSSLSPLSNYLRAHCSGVKFPSLASHLGNQERGNRFSLCLSVYERTVISQDFHKYLFSWNCLHMTLFNKCWHPLLFGLTYGNCCEAYLTWGGKGAGQKRPKVSPHHVNKFPWVTFTVWGKEA